ncbi:MAG TPA: DUF2252 family protein, partial [Bdellovibrionales bacterium]|nr:DUF2252 family protein [Bdellovibrionales bacterium]
MNQFLAVMLNRILLALVITFASGYARAQACSSAAAPAVEGRRPERTRPRFEQTEEAWSFSKFLRSNARHYWGWSRNNAVTYLEAFLRHTGLVVGDMHMNNLAFVKLKGRLKFKVNDLDDGGNGPFVLDLAHHIITTRAVN